MEIHDFLENLAGEYAICEYAFGEPSMIEFSDKVFTICETDCSRYGHSWACPPHAGLVEENIKRIGKYKKFFLFSTVWEVENDWDTNACLEIKKEHEIITRDIRDRIYQEYNLKKESMKENPNPDIYILSTGCTICDTCSCPEEPCKHPQERLMSMESHGILIVKLVEDCGLTAKYDTQTLVYFSLILY